MNWNLIRGQLIARGYWDEAGDGTGGKGDGGSGGEGGGDAGGQGGGDPAAGGKGDPDPNKPSEAEAKLLKEVMQRKEKEKALQAELEAIKSKFSGLDADQMRQMLKDKQDEETRKLEESRQWDALKKQMNEQHATEVSTLKQQLDELRNMLSGKDGVIDQLSLGSAFSGSKFIGEQMVLSPAKVRSLYGDHFEIKDGEIIAYDKPKGAKDRTPMVDGKGDNLPFEAAIQRIIEADPDKNTMLRAKQKPGAGSSTQTGGKPGQGGGQQQEVRGEDRIAKAIANGAMNGLFK